MENDDADSGSLESASAVVGESRAFRVCPRCAEQSHANGRYCPQCGRRFVGGSRRLSKRAQRVAYATVAVLLLAGAGTSVILVRDHDRGANMRRVAALARREQVEEEARNRTIGERQVERSIAADARKLARAGALDGPILGATCTPMSGPTTNNLASSIVSYNCIAIRRRRGRTIEGARFFATVDPRTRRFTFGGD
jgi:hypothetical protein